ncbi:MAG: antibiotic biosynthesis monooxygenase [Acidobacteriota bacterium]|jgi:heme-degrading monooxygenase HmoA
MTAGKATLATMGMFYDVLPGRETEFEEKFARVVQAMREQDGHRDTVLYRRVDRPGSYAILSEWDSPAAFQAFIGSDTFRAVTDWGKAGILAGRPRHRVFADES